MITIRSLVLLLLVHWLADFALQTQEQANNKYKDILALGMHALTYGAAMTLAIFCIYKTLAGCIVVGCIIFVFSHFLIDMFTSKVTHELYEQKRYHDFFVVIGFDQLLHMLTIIWVCCGNTI